MNALSLLNSASSWAYHDRLMFDSIAGWLNTARYNQLRPRGQWRIWLLLAGRGFGKTRTAAEDMKRFAWEMTKARIGVFAATFADGRDVCFEGESGLLNIIPEPCIDSWNRSIGELRLVNGSLFRLFSADEPDRVRGHQFHRAWADELASYKGKISKKDAANEGVPGTPKPMLAQIELATRLKSEYGPQIVITTTPRPLKILKEIKERKNTVFTSGSSLENKDHLAPEALQSIMDLYGNTRLGRQEIFAEILEDVEGALWTHALIDEMRLNPMKDQLPEFKRTVIAVDPAVTANKRSNETGLMAIGLTFNNRAVLLQDGSDKLSPDGWGSKTVAMYQQWGAHRIVAEKNQGGDMVERVIRTVPGGANLPIKLVDATKGKVVRAEPVAGLYEQKKVSHWGVFPALEEQMCTFTGEEGEESPDRMDALVWGLTELMLTGKQVPYVAASQPANPNYWVTGSPSEFSLTTDSFITMDGGHGSF